MSLFEFPPTPSNPLGYHHILFPTPSVKVSPIVLGGISIGSSWSSFFGMNEGPFSLLHTYLSPGGNFIDTSNIYNSKDSKRLIGEWMESRGVRDQIVIDTKYSAGYKGHDQSIQLYSNYTDNSAKSMHINVRDSLKKCRIN